MPANDCCWGQKEGRHEDWAATASAAAYARGLVDDVGSAVDEACRVAREAQRQHCGPLRVARCLRNEATLQLVHGNAQQAVSLYSSALRLAEQAARELPARDVALQVAELQACLGDALLESVGCAPPPSPPCRLPHPHAHGAACCRTQRTRWPGYRAHCSR